MTDYKAVRKLSIDQTPGFHLGPTFSQSQTTAIKEFV